MTKLLALQFTAEILVQKLLKSVELFKSCGLFGEPKVVDFLVFGKMSKK
jgi:hypothetical protein